MKVTPYETYQTYLSMKSHFTNRKYDFFKYGGKSRATVSSFNKEKISIGLKRHQENTQTKRLQILVI